MKVDFVSDTTEVWDLYPTFSGVVAFDIGANGGMVANILAQHFNKVVALEPAEESYAVLRDTAPANVTPLKMAASSRPGQIKLATTTLTPDLGELFTPNDTMPWGEVTGSRTVTATTVDQLAQIYGTPDFIKIDTEGHEVAVLQGAEDLFEFARPAFVIEIHSSENGKVVQGFLDAHHHPYRLIRHEAYRTTSPYRHVHYWLVSVKESDR